MASACTSDPVVTSTSTPGTAGTTVPATTSPSDPAYLENIPLDGDVRAGVLDNGLTYHVRHNEAPGGQLQLRLAVNAGSVLEDEDQSGAAHFLEHMMFNGTERWPGNELIAVLEGFGSQFGPDINAYTSYDETVYQLVVPNEGATVDLAFDVLREWAGNATLDQTEVEAERGVIVEEWRLRDQGIGGRISTLYEELLLAGTGYGGQAPIGEQSAIEATDSEELRRFYEDWYRPDLMAVVAVGDVDVDDLEAAIVERFGTLVGPAEPTERPEITVAAQAQPRFVSFADPDLPAAFGHLLYPTGTEELVSYGATRDAMAAALGFDLVRRRLDEDVAAGSASFFSVDYQELALARAMTIPGLAVDADPEEVGGAILDLATEIERVRRHGFGEAELSRAVAAWRADADQALASARTRQDAEFAEGLVALFLARVPVPSAEAGHDITIRALEEMTLQRVEDAFVEVVDGTAPAVMVVGPASSAQALPDEAQLAESLEFVATADIEARPDEDPSAGDLMVRPEPAPISSRTEDAFDVTWLTFGNGVRVGLIPTTISQNAVLLLGSSYGGTSVVAAADVAEAFAISDIVATSGAGDLTRVELDRLLTGKVVEVSPFIGPTTEGIFGRSASEELETMLQLAHLTMTAPRADGGAVESFLGEVRPFAASPGTVAGLAAGVALAEARYGEDNPWYAALPRIEELDAFDVAAALAVYRDRFGDAGDFVFVLAGDFNPDDVVDLVAGYLGTLPATGRADGFVDRQPDPPQGAVVETVHAGTDEQAAVSFLVTGALDAGSEDRIHAQLLQLVLDTRLRNRLREALSATYSPQVEVSTTDEPDALIETYIEVSGSPDRLDEISQETVAVLRDLAANGPTEAELATARQQLTRQFEFVSNEFWIETLLFYANHPDESLDDVGRRIATVEETTTADLQDLAAIAFPDGRYVEVRQLPAQ